MVHSRAIILCVEGKEKMIFTNNVEKFKQELKTEESPKIVMAQDDAFNRKAIEYGRFDILLGIENIERKLTVRQIDSGLNPFLISLMKKNNISLGIDIAFLRSLEKRKKARILSQMMQNIKLCRKRNVKLVLFSAKDKKDSLSLLQSMGASSQQTKKALSF